nr:hypothetical protein [Tanacetum cinerariifolium]
MVIWLHVVTTRKYKLKYTKEKIRGWLSTYSPFEEVTAWLEIQNRLLAAKGLQVTLLMLFAKGFGNLSQVTLLRPFVFECRTPEIGHNMKLT